jgi:hypothetical protein
MLRAADASTNLRAMMRANLAALAISVVTSACQRKTLDSGPDSLALPSEGTKIPPKPPQFSTPSEEQRARKARSEERLRAEGVPIDASLPVIADKSTAKLRTKDAIVDRLLALLLVSMKGEGLSQEKVLQAQTELGAAPFLSPEEKAFVALAAPNQHERAKFSWRYEGMNVLHWSLGRVEKLEKPEKVVDAGRMVKLVHEPGVAAYRASAKPRSVDEILDEADLIYRYDWACVDARVSKQPNPAGIDCEVVVERHQALNWLYGYQGQDWDDVSTDT